MASNMAAIYFVKTMIFNLNFFQKYIVLQISLPGK